jgi:glycosyltransferase involved in cell wall biosynthesis
MTFAGMKPNPMDRSTNAFASALKRVRIAVLVPCYNEAATIGDVVQSFAHVLPSANIYVYDNNSTDQTIQIARSAGATVRSESRQGKGHVVRRMFADIEADLYIMVDGDSTYDADAAPMLIEKALDGNLDFVNAARESIDKGAYRPGHRFGNRVLSGLVQMIFGRQFDDMLSGYKILSRRFVKSFPAMSRGFETETELAIHALELRMPSAEVKTRYGERPEGSHSKLRTYRDGFRIVTLIGRLVKDERPFLFFGTIGVLSVALGLVLGLPVVLEYLETGLVPRFPTAILSSGLTVIGTLSFLAGLILDMVTKLRHEMKRLAYLSIPAVNNAQSEA